MHGLAYHVQNPLVHLEEMEFRIDSTQLNNLLIRHATCSESLLYGYQNTYFSSVLLDSDIWDNLNELQLVVLAHKVPT